VTRTLRNFLTLALLCAAALPTAAQDLLEVAPVEAVDTKALAEAETRAVLSALKSAEPGELLYRSGNREIVKASGDSVTARIYSAPQFTADGAPLCALDPLTGRDVFAGKGYVRFLPDADTGKLAVKETRSNTGVKRDYTILGPTTTRAVWVVDSDLPAALVDGALVFGAGEIVTPAPTAWDMDGRAVSVSAAYDGKSATLTYTLTYPKGCVFPVTLDPTVSVAAGRDGRVSVTSGVSYAAARDAATGTESTLSIQVGQNFSTPNYTIYRGFLSFPIGDITSVSFAKIYLDGNTDNSTTDLEVYVLGSTYGPTLAGGDYIAFDGRQTGGAHTGTVLNETWNSSSFSSNWNIITMNAAGRDSLYAARNDTLWLALISKEDYDNSAPTGSEYVAFSQSAAGISALPYLQFTYAPAAGYADTTVLAGRDGYAQNTGANYAASRDGAGNGTSSTTIKIGQQTTSWGVYRGFLSFPVPNIAGNYTAATLNLRGGVDGSTTDFNLYVHGASAYRSVLATADFPAFNGRQTGTAHTGTVLNEAWSSASMASWNTLTLNAAGLDSLNAAQGDTLWLAIISKEDYDNSEPAGNEYLIFESSVTADTEPYLSLTYPAQTAPTVATDAASAVTISTATLGGEVTDTGMLDITERGVAWGTSVDPDTTGTHTSEIGTFGAGTFSFAVTGLAPNTVYHVRAWAVNAQGISYGTDVTFTTDNYTVYFRPPFFVKNW
jgi:hypothetical protein